jgi:hypothetical protein
MGTGTTTGESGDALSVARVFHTCPIPSQASEWLHRRQSFHMIYTRLMDAADRARKMRDGVWMIHNPRYLAAYYKHNLLGLL